MKIAVYTIAKNEEQFVERWYESAKGADYILIADTGSTDNTVHIAKKLGINVVHLNINPWRFDRARNNALKCVPHDIDFCIALDMDEVLQPGWREKLEKVSTDTTRPRYNYTWSWNADGTPGLVYGGDKIHSRHRYHWKHPVHEVLICEGKEVQNWTDLEIHHYPDSTKSRGQYFPLLKLAIEEDPTDDRNAFYYARELFFHGYNDEAIRQFVRHLKLSKATWRPERAASMRYLAKLETKEREVWLLRAVAEAPERREGWVDLAHLYYEQKRWSQCLAAAQRALEIIEKPLEYLCEEFAWGALPFDLAAIAAHNIGLRDYAKNYGTQALELDPNNERLRTNLDYYTKKSADAIL